MTPDDPRHGTDRGHNAHMRAGTKPCVACIRAHTKMNKLRLMYPERFRKVPSIGPRRRLQALQALGYGRDYLALELGYGNGGSLAYLMSPKSATVTQQLDRRIRALYDRLCMAPPPTGVGAKRARTWARRHGFAPPLAWDVIDDPDEQPTIGTDHRSRDDIDPVVVERVLTGDKLPTTRAEKDEIVRRWKLSGRSLAELERATGWRVERYAREAAA